MTKKQMKKALIELVNEIENKEEFMKNWDLTQDQVYPFMVGYLKSRIGRIANEGETLK